MTGELEEKKEERRKIGGKMEEFSERVVVAMCPRLR